MSRKAAITVLRQREDVERLWQSSEYRQDVEAQDAVVTFREAPGDRGTEIHVDLGEDGRVAKLGQAVGKLTGSEPLAKVKDDLRRFKQVVETGVIARSEGSPEGETAGRKLKQRPGQPLDESETEKAGI